MKESRKYRILIFVLTGLFCLFNVGVPIVVAACPMSGPGPMCGSCSDFPRDGATGFLPYNDTSCCLTILAAERNTVAFLKAATCLIGEDVVLLICEILPTDNASISSLSRFPSITFTVPGVDDLPVFLSALLV
jgi:hypothetical protein